MGIKEDAGGRIEEDHARFRIATSVIEHIEENYSLGLNDAVLAQIKSKYELRIQRLNKNVDNKLTEDEIKEFHKIQRDLISRERVLLENLSKEKQISAEALRKLEYELDLEDARIDLELETK